MKDANKMTFDEILSAEEETTENEKPTESKNSEQITIKYEQKHNFIIVYDSVYKNTKLTLEEIGLICKLLSVAPTFKPNLRKLSSILKINIKHLNKITKSLENKGYLKIKKFGKNSEWTITQEPFINQFNDLSEETLINALLDFKIDLRALKRLHKMKYIDDKKYIKIVDSYIKEINRIAKVDWLKDNDE